MRLAMVDLGYALIEMPNDQVERPQKAKKGDNE